MKTSLQFLIAISSLAAFSACTEKPQADRAITTNSAGPIKLGMTVAEAREAMKTATLSRASDGEGIALIDVSLGDVGLMTLYANEEDPEAPINENAVIDFIEVWNPDFKTAEGVHAGMELSEAEKRYGKVRDIMMSEIESRESAQFADQPPSLFIRVIHETDTAGKYGEGERTSAHYNPGATIFSIGVSLRQIMAEGSIASLRINSTEAEVRAAVEERQLGPFTKGEDEIWEALGEAVQTWTFAESGLSLDMISEEIGGSKTVFAITLEAPAVLKTGQGIGIGSAKPEVVEAYAGFQTDPGEGAGFSENGDVYLVGSLFGGIVFTFEEDKVARIYLGASAE